MAGAGAMPTAMPRAAPCPRGRKHTDLKASRPAVHAFLGYSTCTSFVSRHSLGLAADFLPAKPHRVSFGVLLDWPIRFGAKSVGNEN